MARVAETWILVAVMATSLGACRPAPEAKAQARPLETPTAQRIPVRSGDVAGRYAVRSLLNVDRPMRYGDYQWDESGVAPGPMWVRVDLSRQLISVFRAGDEIGTAVILYGGDGVATPTGDFTVLQKAADYHSHTYDAPMPFMLRLTADGVAIHASDVREGWATHGCIGVPPEFARRLYSQAKLGDHVTIG